MSPETTHPPAQEIRALSFELTEACNYRCKMCDYWQIKDPTFLPVKDVRTLLELVEGQPLRNITITGGEPLLHPKWRDITCMLPEGARRFLCTNGSPVLSKNHDVGELYDVITVSADGATEDTFQHIRGRRHLRRILKALEKIKGMYPKVQLELKMTIQRDNYHEVLDFFALAKSYDFLDAVCFGIPDTSQQAFGLNVVGSPESEYLSKVMLTPEQTREFAALVDRLYDEYAEEVAKGFLLEGNLRRYVARFEAYNRTGQAPEPRDCRIAYHTIVLKANGTIKGCYFLGDTTTIGECRKAGSIAPHSKRLDGYSPFTHRTCRNCDQIDVLGPGIGVQSPNVILGAHFKRDMEGR
jgi:MoaA/NifB/PqqE/SkfB family radical SAM enzyme